MEDGTHVQILKKPEGNYVGITDLIAHFDLERSNKFNTDISALDYIEYIMEKLHHLNRH